MTTDPLAQVASPIRVAVAQMKYRRQAGGKRRIHGGRNAPEARDTAHPATGASSRAPAPETSAQFCVSGFSVVHRKPVQFFGVK